MSDREKVLNGLRCLSGYKEMVENPCAGCGYIDCQTYAICIAQVAADALELLKEQGWNLIAEDDDGIIHGLPGDDGQYLMTDGKDIWIDDYADGVDDGVFLDSGRDIREVKAWMYMPELPNANKVMKL